MKLTEFIYCCLSIYDFQADDSRKYLQDSERVFIITRADA